METPHPPWRVGESDKIREHQGNHVLPDVSQVKGRTPFTDKTI